MDGKVLYLGTTSGKGEKKSVGVNSINGRIIAEQLTPHFEQGSSGND